MSRANVVFIAAAVGLTLLAGGLLLAEYPTVQRLPGWFWVLHDTDVFGVGLIFAIAFGLVLLMVVRFVADTGRDGWRLPCGVAVLIVLGFVMQQGLAFAERRGLNGMRDRMLRSGHAEFAWTASLDITAWQVLTRYEELVRAPSQQYARSKPPGHLLFYIMLARVADRVMPQTYWIEPPAAGLMNARHARLVSFAAIVLPLVSYLVLIPLAGLARMLLSDQRALWPALLFIVAPATALVTMHLDQALYPTLATTLLALAAAAGRNHRRVWIWATLAGMFAWLSLFVSFSLLPALPLAAAVAWVAIDRARGRQRLYQYLQILAGSAAAFVLLGLLAYGMANYDMLHRLRASLESHRQWIMTHHAARLGWHDFTGVSLSAGILNLAEFGYWLGMPLLVLLVWSVGAGARALTRQHHGAMDVVAIVVMALLMLTAFLGGSIGEVARLWLFMIPPVALIAADRLSRLAGGSAAVTLYVVCACQFAWVFLLKAKQDFF